NSERTAAQRAKYRARAPFFYEEDMRYLRFLVPKGLRVLEIGCGTGDVLFDLDPAYGFGIDLSPAMVEEARRRYPALEFRVGDVEEPEVVNSLPSPFDIILIVDTIGVLDDCQGMLERLHRLCHRETRLIVAYYSHLWAPLLRVVEWTGLHAAGPPENVLSPA